MGFNAAPHPQLLREFIRSQPGYATLAVRILSGVLILSPLTLLAQAAFLSLPLRLLLTALFGPFLGLLVSFVYPRVEFWLGRKLGGVATLEELCRLFSWSMLPAGCGCFLSGTILPALSDPGRTRVTVALLPVLVGLGLAGMLYSVTVIAAQQVSTRKGIASLLLTFLLVVFVPASILILLVLAVQYVRSQRRQQRSFTTTLGGYVHTAAGKTALAIILGYSLLFSWMVLYDEPLDPRVTNLLTAPRPDVFQAGNAWMAILGFTSPAGGPPFTREEARLHRLEAAFLAGDLPRCGGDVTAEPNEPLLSFQGDLPGISTGNNRGILAYAAAHPAEIDQLLRDNVELLARYDRLYTFDQYAEPLACGPCMPFPPFAPIRSTQRLKLLQIARATRADTLPAALQAVRQDADFWRFIARDSQTLISKLIALAMLGTDFRFAAELGGHYPLAPQEWESLQAILRPMDNGETVFTKALQGELLYMVLSFEGVAQSAQHDPYAVSLMYKPRATKNRMYSDHQEILRVAAMTAREFSSLTAADRGEFYRINSLSYLYNPVGEILCAIGKPAGVWRYMERGHDLEGARRLALLKILARKEDIRPKEMPSFLETHRKTLGDPYTDGPMQFDAPTKRLYFQRDHRDEDVEIYL